jgi:hypothetical protein
MFPFPILGPSSGTYIVNYPDDGPKIGNRNKLD